MSNVIRIKPHHLIDILTGYGAGREQWEPSPYDHAQHIVAERILSNHDVMLEMCSGADDICKPCIHNIKGVCDDTFDTRFRPQAPSSKREWNLLIDNRWYERLGLQDGDRLTAERFALLLRDSIGTGLDDIYREISTESNAERLAKLKSGVAKYLQQADQRE